MQTQAPQDEASRLRDEVRVLREAKREADRLIAELSDAVAARDLFIATANHDLRNSLGGVLLGVSSALAKARSTSRLPPWVRERLESLDRQVRGFAVRSGRLLDSSRTATGSMEVNRRHISFTALLESLVHDMAPETSRARSVLRVEEGPEVLGWWDPIALEQAVANILSCAIRYGAGQPVHIALSADDDEALLRVRHYGPFGTSDEDGYGKPLPYDEEAIWSSASGTGLGLWVARRLLAAHGGEIVVAPAPGVGSVFTAKLPRAIQEPHR